MAWMPRAVWWADVLEHEWFLCFIFITPCSPHPFPHFYPDTSYSFLVSPVPSLLFALVVSYHLFKFFLHCNYLRVFNLCFLVPFLYLVSCPILFPFVLTGYDVAFVLIASCFSLLLFLSSEGWICWQGTRRKFILDGQPVHVVCLDSASGWLSVRSQF